MKNFTFLILLLATSIASFGQKKWVAAGSGAWETATNWSDGTVPTAGDDVILDNSTTAGPYTVTMLGSGSVITIKSLQIGYTGNTNVINFVISNAASGLTNKLTLDGGGATALHVMNNGVFTNSSTNTTRSVLLKNAADVFKMSSNGKYIHNITSTTNGTLPATGSSNSSDNYNFIDDSSVEISLTGGSATTLKTDYSIPQYNNFIATSATTAGSTLTLFGCSACTNNTVIKKDLTVNTGVFALGSGNGGTLTVNGNVHINSDLATYASGAQLRCAGGAGSQTLIVKGDVSGDGTLNTNTSSAAGLVQITLEGNLYSRIGITSGTSGQNAGNYIKFSGGATAVEFNAANASSIKNIIIDAGKNVTLKGTASFVNDVLPLTKSITINSGGTLTIGSTGVLETKSTLSTYINEIKGAGTLIVDGTLGIGSLSATDAFAGSVYPTTVTLNTGSNVVFNGSAAQNIAAGTFKDVTLNNTAGATLKGAISVNNLSIASGAGILNLGTFTHTSNSLDFDGATQLTNKSYGSSSSSATIQDDTKFGGTGILNNAITLSNKGFEAGTFKYYPNPVENVITLNYINTINTVEVINILGQTVFASQPNKNSTQLDLGSLNKGIYILKVTSNGQTEGVRIFKK